MCKHIAHTLIVCMSLTYIRCAVAALLRLRAAMPGWDEEMLQHAVRLNGWQANKKHSSACSWSFIECDFEGRVILL